MDNFGITPLGFNRKRLDTIVGEVEADLRAIFGANLNLTPESPDGQVVGIFSKALADLYELAESSYNSVNIAAATGASLSRLVQLGGITRQPASASTATIQATGTPGAVIPAGSEVVSPSTAATFTTDEEITLNSAGTGSGTVTALVRGPTAVQAATLAGIGSPVAGWQTVTNETSGTTGTNEETDAELRARFIASRGTAGAGTIDAIYAALANLPGVTELRVEENRNSATVTESGLPGHHIRVTIIGGDEDAIANTIWQNKPAGIGTDGNQFIVIEDSQGNRQGVSFSRPSKVAVGVELLITNPADPEGDPIPNGVQEAIRQAIVSWSLDNLSVGENVIASQLYTPVNEVIGGYQVLELRVRLEPDGGSTAQVAMASDNIADISVDNVRVLVV